MNWPFASSPGPAAGNRRREPVVRRLQRWARRAAMFCLVCLLVAAAFCLCRHARRFIHQSDYFQLRSIEIAGASPELEAEARAALGRSLAGCGGNLYRASRSALTRELLALPRTRSVQVFKVYPGVLRADFSERVPVAVAQLDRPYLMDAEGVLIDRADPARLRRIGLPVLTGVRRSTPRLGDRLAYPRLAEVLEAVRYLDQNDDFLRSRIVEWNISAYEQVTAILRQGIEVRFGDRPPLELLDKLSGGLRVNQQLEHATYIDLRMDHQIVFR